MVLVRVWGTPHVERALVKKFRKKRLQGTRNTPDNFGSAAGGFTQALGGWAGSKLERVEFPAGSALAKAQVSILWRCYLNSDLIYMTGTAPGY